MSNDPARSMVAEFGASASDYLGRSSSLARLRARRDGSTGYDRGAWVDIGSLGWLGILVPESRGGLGAGLRELCAVAEVVGTHLPPEPVLAAGTHVQALLCSLPESAVGADLLARLLAGNLIAGVAWQEHRGQLEPGDAETRLLREEGELLLSGAKHHVAVGAGAGGWLVHATAPEGAALCWVPEGAPGLQVDRATMADGSAGCSLRFTRVPVPARHVLATGAAALEALRYANDVTRIAQGAELLGVARRALALALAYARTRVQFGSPIGSFQALQHRLVDAFIQTELSAACLAAALTGIEETPEHLRMLASRVKARSAHAALAVTRLAIQIHGAMGFTDECDIGLYFKRALTLSAWLGNARAHRGRHFALRRLAGASLLQDTSPLTDPPAAAPFPRESDWGTISEADFRRGVRRFFQDRFPAHLRNSPYRLRWAEIKDWFMTLSRQGWIAPAWPQRFGGMGLPADKLLAFIEEQERHGVARVPDQGILMLGPLLMRYGTPAQVDEYLPRILAGEHVWCQGYSEPNAGSDLASLRTEAVLQGDHFVVTGQKIWSTLAHDATHMFMLVRTDKNVKAQAGISFLLVDLKTPGITVRPIRDITGHDEFCEVFFDAVKVPRDNLVGALNQGWTMAKALLGFERIYSGSPKQAQYALAQLTKLAEALGLWNDAGFAARYAEVELDAADAAAAYTHFADIVKRGEPLGADVSYLKVWATETYQRIAMLLVEAAEDSGASTGEVAFDETPGGQAIRMDVLAPLYNATPATIYGGSSEIQRNILAKQVLDLPGAGLPSR